MRVLGTLTRISEAAPTETEVRRARVKTARANARWKEIEDDLVARGPYSVSASTDLLYMPYRGAAFQTNSASMISERSELYFVLRDGDALVFFERRPGTWSDLVAKRARREHARARTTPS